MNPNAGWRAPFVVGVVALLVAGCSATDRRVSGTATAPAGGITQTPSTSVAPRPVDNAGLPPLLGSPSVISDLLGITVTPEGIVRKPDTKLSVEPIRCLEAIQAGLNTISLIGRTGFAAQILHGDQHAQVVQMIASFPADADASAFREIVTQKWRRCQNQQATITDGQTSLTYTVDAVDQVNSVAAVSMSVTAGDGTQVTCQHALGARRNVAIDVRVCAPNVANKGRELVAKIAAGL